MRQAPKYSSFGSVAPRLMKCLLAFGVSVATRCLAEASLYWHQSKKASTCIADQLPFTLSNWKLLFMEHLLCPRYSSQDFTRCYNQEIHHWDPVPVIIVKVSTLLTTILSASCWQPTAFRLCRKLRAGCPQRITRTSSFCHPSQLTK